jgi:Na+-driven multidrug efflux pump
MKRIAFFSLFLFGILTIASGFFSGASDVPWAAHLHVAAGVLFVLLIVGHVRHSARKPRPGQ